jgi:hypothetical protein
MYKRMEPGGIALVECLANMAEALGLILSTGKKKTMNAHARDQM